MVLPQHLQRIHRPPPRCRRNAPGEYPGTARANCEHVGAHAAATVSSAPRRGTRVPDPTPRMGGTAMTDTFELDISRIRDEARKRIDAGAVTSGNELDIDRLIDLLNQVVATEIVCHLRYSQNAIVASGIDRAQVASEFAEHATEELQHGQRAAERINQLGGTPDMNPATLAERSHTDYVATDPTDLEQMLRENLVAERIVITTYQEIVRWIGDADPTTRRVMESILEEEEEHADDLSDLLGL
ncbi:ferritin-like fold-containing protein [Tomitella gaofuii]|uniref:ferritin-like fold-containing protein n=2 Tax=Tomitella gaofuii TaxID=2760083 RepID=UPI003B8A83D9